MANSRKKGARGEKKAIQALQAWTGFEFARVPASGGLRWKKADNITGDVVCIDPLHRFNFSVEMKNYRDINFEHMIMPGVKSRILDEFWPQCLSDGERGKKIPLLLMRYDGIRPGDFFFSVMRTIHFKELKPQLKKGLYMRLSNGLVLFPSPMLFESDYKAINKISIKIVNKQWK